MDNRHHPHHDGSEDEVGDAASMEVDPARVLPAMDSVVRVFCVHAEPNFSMPWQRKRQYSSTSSGFVISESLVLTNAHSVEHYAQVKLKKRGSDTKYLASVLAIGTECDIAILTVENSDFWKGISPVTFGNLPALREAVNVMGYPVGGQTMSVTRGIVSRIEVIPYYHGRTNLLGLEVDAAIDFGNSGGPVFDDRDQCIGIAFQFVKPGLNNIGHVIPIPIIQHFLEDFQNNGRYTGFPTIGVCWQNMENTHLRNGMGMASDQSGVLIRGLTFTTPNPHLMLLKPGDILLSIDEEIIGNDGTFSLCGAMRIDFSHLISRKQIGERAKIKLLRNSKVHKFDVELESPKFLVPTHSANPPSYYIVGGLVFVAASIPYLRSEYGDDFVNSKHKNELPKSLDDQIVYLSLVLADDINMGYENIARSPVFYFNGKVVTNLKDLVKMVESCTDKFLKFDFGDQLVILGTDAAKAAVPRILARHFIASSMSDDLKS